MRPEVATALRSAVGGLKPNLDAAGVRISHLYLAADGSRFSIGCNVAGDAIPDFLIDAVTAVTTTDVDFDRDRIVSIAAFTNKDRTSTVMSTSIEDLLAARNA